MDNQRIGTFIRELRKEKGMTQKDLAEHLHITDRAVSKWERGICAPDIALLEPLAELLGVTVGELLLGERTARPEFREPEEIKTVLDYSKGEVARKVGAVQKKYLGLLAGVLALVLLIGGALLWRSGVLFLLDTKVSPNGESVIRVYSKKWDSWPLHFTLGDTVQTVGEIGPSVGGGNLYVNYGGVYADFTGTVDNPTAYEGLWWAPDSTKYVIAFRWLDEDVLHLELNDLVRNCGTNLRAGFNLSWWLTKQGLAPRWEEPPKIDYQFLQWGKDSASMLIYYSYEDGGLHEGYFWYNCETETVSGILELGGV